MNGASDKLPRLIADLILATSPVPDAMRFLSDGAGRVRGFDAVLVSPGSKPFVPQGKSYWEFGCSEDIATKAKGDVAKRTREVDVAERAQATLVFVSPRHYDNPRKDRTKFQSELSNGSGWKEVRIYDGAELRHWLNMAPGVAARWAKLEMGAYPVGVSSTEEFWEEYASRFERRMREDVLLAGRRPQAEALVARLSRLAPDRIPVHSDSQDESVAFTVAAIRAADPATRLVLEARTLIVAGLAAVREVMDQDLIFIPLGEALAQAGMLLNRGPTVLPLARIGATAGGITLPRPSRHDFAEALMSSDLLREQAMQLASECGRSVTVLARRRPSTTSCRPHWGDRTELVPALLAGGWDSANPHDMKMLSTLAGRGGEGYAGWQVEMQPLLLGEDPAIEREGTVWKVRAPVDAFVTLGRHVGSHHFDRLREVAHEVFSDRNANVGKTPTERMMSGPDLRHSIWLREGLATTLLLSATLEEAADIAPALAGRGGAQTWVDSVVGSLPGLGSDVSLLASLREALPLLAEAAPRPFVAALGRLVRQTPEEVATLFVERVEFISPESDHVWLLWALETLAWDPAMLMTVSVILARLAALDPGGKLVNRPQHSLREVLLPWLPHTDAPLPARLGALKAVIRTDAQVGWRLLLELLPAHHAHSSSTHRPKMRDAGASDVGIPIKEAAEAYRFASSQLLALVGDDQTRWNQLIERLPNLASDDLASATERLDGLLRSFDDDQREVTWHKLRDLVSRHAGLPDADWTMTGEPLEALSRLVDRWAPDDPIKAAVMLFDDPRYGHASYPPVSAAAQDVEARSEIAVHSLLAAEGHQGLLRLASATRSAWVVGKKVAEVVADVEDGFALCKTALAAGGANHGEFAVAVSAGLAMREPTAWVGMLKTGLDRGLPPDHVAQLLLGLHDETPSWDLAEQLGPAVEKAYWERKRPWRLEGRADIERAAVKLMQVGRALAGLSLLADAVEPSAPLVFAALDQAASEMSSDTERHDPLASYHVERIFEALRRRPDVDTTELARREFTWFPLLAGPGRPRRDLALFEMMARDPADFVALLQIVFKPASSERQEVDEKGKVRWRAAYNVIEEFRSIPGLGADGLDEDVLGAWVRRAHELLREADIEDVGMQYVGRLLAHCPADPDDGAWPASALRNLVDDLGNEHLETGIAMERFSMRGAYYKGLYDGGTEEREFARLTRSWAGACAAWPRTADLLRRIALDWDIHADREDTEARQRKMRD